MSRERTMDRKAELLKEMQEELDRRTEVENQAISLISEGRCQEATELLATLDNSVIEMLNAEYEVLEEMEGKAGEKSSSYIKLSQVIKSDLVDDDTEVFIFDKENETFASGTWHNDNVSKYLKYKVESVTWRDSNELHVNVKQGQKE